MSKPTHPLDALLPQSDEDQIINQVAQEIELWKSWGINDQLTLKPQEKGKVRKVFEFGKWAVEGLYSGFMNFFGGKKDFIPKGNSQEQVNLGNQMNYKSLSADQRKEVIEMMKNPLRLSAGLGASFHQRIPIDRFTQAMGVAVAGAGSAQIGVTTFASDSGAVVNQKIDDSLAVALPLAVAGAFVLSYGLGEIEREWVLMDKMSKLLLDVGFNRMTPQVEEFVQRVYRYRASAEKEIMTSSKISLVGAIGLGSLGLAKKSSFYASAVSGAALGPVIKGFTGSDREAAELSQKYFQNFVQDKGFVFSRGEEDLQSVKVDAYQQQVGKSSATPSTATAPSVAQQVAKSKTQLQK
jgi:hypothetical protein